MRGNLGDFKITDKDRQDYIDSELQFMIQRYKLEYPDATSDDINDASQQFLSDIQDKVDDKVNQLKNNQFIDRIVKDLLVRGYSISSIYADSFDGIGESATRAAQLNQEDFTTAQPAYIIYDKSKYTQNNLQNISESIAKFDDQDFLTSEQDDDTLTDLKNLTEGKNKALDDVKDKALKDENDISDILGGLKQVEDENISLIDDASDNSASIDNLLGDIKQVDSDLIQYDDDKFDEDAVNICKQ